jgi:hypothetical protein
VCPPIEEPDVPDLSASLPRALAAQTKFMTLAGVPALVAHPDWSRPAPLVIWMHGRTVNKELDPGRYLRWIRAGIAACALDLPGHGERLEPAMHTPACLDFSRLAIGGMSAGGMATLRRLCDPHPFVAACVEATCGDFTRLYDPSSGSARPWVSEHGTERIAALDPARRLNGWRPIPLLALHSEGDEWVPWGAQRGFLERLGAHYAERGAARGLIEVKTWSETGAPFEHAGFGKFGPEAKTVQTEFLVRALGVEPRGPESV